jgi:hypothetical protein
VYTYNFKDRYREICIREITHGGAVEAISMDSLKVVVAFRMQMVIGFTLDDGGKFIYYSQLYTHNQGRTSEGLDA